MHTPSEPPGDFQGGAGRFRPWGV